MNPFRSVTPWDYESTLVQVMIFMAIVVLGGAWLTWVWRHHGAGKNHYVYASVAIGLAALLPVEQLLGPWLSANQAYRMTRVTYYARYACSGAAVLLAFIGLIRAYPPPSRQLAGPISLVLGALIGILSFLAHILDYRLTVFLPGAGLIRVALILVGFIVLIIVFVWIYFPRPHRTVGGQLAGAIGLVLGALVGIFTYTQQIWKIENPPEMREIPNDPRARGGRYFISQHWRFGFIVPAREWLEELAAVRPKDTVVVLNQHTLRAHTRVYAERGTPSLLVLRDRCLADLRVLNPDVVVEKEEKTTINNLEAMRLEARATQDGTERRFCCTVLVAKETESAFRVISWSAAAVYPQVQSDIEFMHKTFQLLTRQQK